VIRLKIKIDSKKCINPQDCNKCLNICPTGVFFLSPQGKFSPKPEFQRAIEKLNYKLIAPFTEVCNLCMECVAVCPAKAITIRQ